MSEDVINFNEKDGGRIVRAVRHFEQSSSHTETANFGTPVRRTPRASRGGPQLLYAKTESTDTRTTTGNFASQTPSINSYVAEGTVFRVKFSANIIIGNGHVYTLKTGAGATIGNPVTVATSFSYNQAKLVVEYEFTVDETSTGIAVYQTAILMYDNSGVFVSKDYTAHTSQGTDDLTATPGVLLVNVQITGGGSPNAALQVFNVETLS